MAASVRAHIVSVGLQLAAENNCLQEHVSIRLLAARAKVTRGMARRWWNHCPAVREELTRQGLRRVPSAGRGHNVGGGSPSVSHDTPILDGNLVATLQTEASRMTLKLPKDPLKSKTVQLMEVTEKLWKSEKYQKKAHEAITKLPIALKAIAAANDGPTGR